jgi:hypothetical protein
VSQILDGVAANARVDKFDVSERRRLREHAPQGCQVRHAMRPLGQAIAEEDDAQGSSA